MAELMDEKNLKMLLNTLKEVSFTRKKVLTEIWKCLNDHCPPEEQLQNIRRMVEMSGVYTGDNRESMN